MVGAVVLRTARQAREVILLQLIGWLGCLYLIVKAMEIAANGNFRDGNGRMSNLAMGAAVLCWFGAAGFALAFKAQGEAFPTVTEPATAESSCLESAHTVAEINACADAASR